ncbi:site-specific DNA-methyltransferase [Desulfovibrio sp. OttesenSCG-928-A18]|nr:site-specific DNA-methyltransferase [Desulfovibrio sp. OttesenSCG-928-A18]
MKPYFTGPHGALYQGDSLAVLSALPSESVQCCVTSPPYWGLRDYGADGQIGLEETPQDHIERLLSVFREVYRVLKNDGTLWMNYGDTYLCQQGKGFNGNVRLDSTNKAIKVKRPLPAKNLLGLPWRLALALQDDGWILRADIIWHKPNPMPESCKDRPTRAHEYLFLFGKRPRYFYDAEAIREPVAALCEHDATGPGYSAPGQAPHTGSRPRMQSAQALSFAREVDEPDRPGQAYSQHRPERAGAQPRNRKAFRGGGKYTSGQSFDNTVHVENAIPGDTLNETYTRNKRTVWTIPTFPCPGAHFATFPPKLAETCILAGSRHGDTVLDPFMGSGTTGMVARQLGRKWLGVELNPEYCALALKRIGVNRVMLTELV